MKNFRTLSSVGLERYIDTVEVSGSTPLRVHKLQSNSTFQKQNTTMKKINYKKIIFYNILIFIFSSQLFSQNKLTIDDIFGAPKFKMKSLSAPNWMNDGERYTFMEFNAETKSSDLFLYNVKIQKERIISYLKRFN